MTLNMEWLLVPDGKKRKYPMSGSCVEENALLMSEENGQTG